MTTTTSAATNPSARIPPRVLARCADASPYDAERPPQPIDLWLDLNEAAGPDDASLDALRAIDAESVRRYPDAAPLEHAFAQRLGVEPPRVLAAAGGDDAIDRVCRVMLDESRTLITHTPGFSMIAASARRTGAQIRAVPWEEGPFPTDDLLAAIDDSTGVVALVSPNNPTGLAIGEATVRSVAERCAATGALLLLDLAYTEFAEVDLTPCALGLPNTVVVRTLSKARALAGLRAGFLVGDGAVVRACRAVGGPFAVAGPSVAAALASLRAGDARTSSRVGRIAAERRDLAGALRALAAAPLETQANFVFARLGTPSRALWARDALRSLGIAARAWPDDPPLADALRITCPGDEDAFARLTHALRAALAPQALLLDLDGVLADVSRSYRAAILATCESFGVRATPADVASLKARGDANNDWLVTRELLARRGLTLDLADVTERFEAIYQGAPGSPGLRETETLIGALDVVRALARRLPLAIVTGRPRADALRFLDRAGLTPLFRAVVCMEDGPPKPDPAVVRRALRLLGVERAWMVGDTVDDVRAARAAGVVPVGVVAPQDDPRATTPLLLRAGAARTVHSLADLTEILP